MKKIMAEVGEVDVEPVDTNFSVITVDGFAVKVPTAMVEIILTEGPLKIMPYTVQPTTPS